MTGMRIDPPVIGRDVKEYERTANPRITAQGNHALYASLVRRGGFTDYRYDAGVFSVQPKLSSQPPQQVSEEQFQEIYHRYLELDHPPVSTDFTLPSWKKAPPSLANAYIGRLVHYFETGK